MINLKFVFNRSKRLRSKDGKGKLHLYVSYERVPSYYDTEILLLPHQWNDTKKIIIGHIDSDELNDDLEDMMIFCNRFYRKCKREKTRFSIKKLFAALDDNEYNESNDLDFLQFCKELHKVEVPDLAESTAKKRVDLFNRLQGFRSEIFMSEIDIQFIEDFKAYLFKQKSNRGTFLGANYVSSLFVLMKKFVRAARIKGYIADDPFLGFKINKTAKIITVLNEDELEKIWAYEAKGKYKLVRIRMLFLFYTGIRFADAFKLKDEYFQNGILKFVAGKTAKKKGKLARIPMHLFDDRAYHIWKEYGPFKKWHNNNLNTGFRELLQLVGIDKYMTIHDARHSFKSIMLERGYPLHIIAEMMAHSSTATTAKYGSISDNAILKKL